MMETVVQCSNVVRTFVSRNMIGKKQEVRALDGLTLDIPGGIVFGLLGPNGSGKTTTIRILSTLLTPDSGQVRVLGYHVVKEASKVRKRIGLILGGERGLYGRLTGTENLMYFAALNNIGGQQASKRVQEVLEIAGLNTAKGRLVEQYSRGMKQRLHVARGLLADPELIFMDEPTIGLDPMGAQELHQLIPQLVKQGKTILLTTHYMSEADELSNQIAIIDKGKIIALGSPSDIKRRFSKIGVLELILRQSRPRAIEELTPIQGIKRVISNMDGPIQRLTIHTIPDVNVKGSVELILGADNIESIVTRDPTLEEAYLSMFT